jgi:hypothetical protein
VFATGLTLDGGYLYWIDGDGDIARKARRPRAAEPEPRPAPPPAPTPTPAASPSAALVSDIPPEPLGPDGEGKLYRTGLVRDRDLMYYVKNGDVWAVPRKKPGEEKGAAIQLTHIGFAMDYGRYLYWLDGDGDIAVKLRRVGGDS